MQANTYEDPTFNAGRNTSRAILIHQGQILLMERWRDGEHYFSIPGGGIEQDESPEHAVLRELKEETSVSASLGRLLYTWKEGTHTHYFYECIYISGEAHLPADAEEAGDENNKYKPRWIKYDEIKNLPYGYWRPVADQLLKDLALGFPTKPISIDELA